MWRVCVQPSAFCKLLFAENKRLIRSIQTSLHTSKEVVLTQGRGKYMSPPDRIIHFTGIFSLQFPGWKINILSSSASTVYSSLLCLLQSADGMKSGGREGVRNIFVIHILIAFESLIIVFDGSGLQGSCFLMIISHIATRVCQL